MPTPEPDDISGLTEVTKVLFAAAGGALGVAAAGPFGAAIAAGAIQGADAAVDAIGSWWRSRATAGAVRAVEVAINRSGLSEAELVRALARSPEVMLVAATALNAAAETAVEDKILLMGRVLANAATDKALVDEHLLVATAMRVLEAPHIRTLALLNEPPDDEADPSQIVRWSPALISARLQWPSRAVTSVLLTLQSVAAALLTSSRIDGGRASYSDLLRVREPVRLEDMACEITDFGAHLIDLLSAIDGEDPQ